MITLIDKLISEDLNKGEEYWTFKEDAERDYVHGLFAYPAMMVPKMQREILGVLRSRLNMKRSLTIYDPFMGSGTILVEGMLNGDNIVGVDINPLAFLVSKVKTSIYSVPRLERSIRLIIKRVNGKFESGVTTSFDNIDKWFKPDIIKELDHIKKQIEKESSIKIRRLLWVTFSETVRTVSNSRSCTYKLYIKEAKSIESFNKSAIKIFTECLELNFNGIVSFQNVLLEKGFLVPTSRGFKYSGIVDVRLNDSIKISKSICKRYRPDLVITSPPYGDNQTTVTYGQYSVLALRWINIRDIGGDVDQALINSQSEIDRKSMGGSIQRLKQVTQRNELKKRSAILENQLDSVGKIDSGKVAKIVSFYADFDRFIITLEALPSNTYVVMTVGNRMVAKQKIKMDEILAQLFESHNFELSFKFSRRIINKRMSIVNAVDKESGELLESMNREYVLILKKR